VRQCVVAASSRSQAMFGLTRGGRQSVVQLGQKVAWAGYYCGDQPGCQNGMRCERFLGRKKIMEKNLGCCSLN
jgi:hypothetical protein